MATNKSGIFTLGDVGDRQSTQSWTTASDVWIVNKPVAVAESPFGYFAGGRGGGQPGPRSDVDRVDYSNDTSIASVRGPLDRHRFYTGAIGSLSYAYVVAGNTGGGDADAETTVSRIDYSNDTNIAAPKGPLTRKSWRPGTAGNSDYGYIAGGGTYPGGTSSKTDRIDYSNDGVICVEKGSLIHNSDGCAGVGNLSYGYFAGGTTPGNKSNVSRLDYANDSTTCVEKGYLSGEKTNLAGAGNANYGYVGGGWPPAKSTVDRID